MIITGYLEQYRSDIAGLCRLFFDEAVHDIEVEPVSDEAINASIDKYKDTSWLLIVDDKCVGVLAGMIVQSGMTSGKFFQEVIWYVKPQWRRYSMRLVDEAIKTFERTDVGVMIMAGLHNAQSVRLHTLYERMGFKPMETHYIKKLRVHDQDRR